MFRGFHIAEEVIARSNCVSKQCQPLISSTVTVTNAPKLFIFSRSKNKAYSFHLLEEKNGVKNLCSPMEEHLLTCHKVSPMEEHLLSCHKVRNIIAHSSCNGLLLVQINNNLFVWNPLTKFFKKVLTYDNLNRECRKRSSSAELCFDSSRDEYKVVLVYPSHSYSCRAEYFYFAPFGATTWEKIEDPYTIDNVYLGTVFKGKKHWVGKGRLSHYDLDEDYFPPPDCIVYFNPRTNVFVKVPIPQPKEGDRDSIVGLGVLDRCLVMTRLDDHEGKLEFLAMKEYGNEDSWVSLFVISSVPKFCRNDVMEPLFKTKEGEIFLSIYKRDSGSNRYTTPSVMCYDVKRKFLRDILVSTENEFKVILYEESWASPRVHDVHNRNDGLWELEDSPEEGFWSRKKKKNKKIKKNHHQMKGKNEHSKRGYNWSASISKRRKGSKGSKRKYEPKRLYANFPSQHDCCNATKNILQGEVVKISRTRSLQISYKTSVIDELYTSMIGSCCDMAEDLLIEVLSRLPIKSLARFKCVSKQWKQLISNAITVKNAPKLLIFSRLKNECSSFYLLNQEICVESTCSPLEDQLLRGHWVKALSSFNGFLLIQIDEDLVMWNPLTKFFRKVLKSTNYYDWDFTHADLCYDYANDEYKVVLGYKHSISSEPWTLEYFYVATCGATSWEKLDVSRYVITVYYGPCFKGFKHWICKSNDRPYNHRIYAPCHIVYFDPSTNELIEVATPQPKNGDRKEIVGLGVVDECLCMTRSRYDGSGLYNGDIEFLVMKEYGNGDSWDIMFVIRSKTGFYYYGAVVPLFKTIDGEILVCWPQEHGWSVKAYDVDGKFLRDVLLGTRDSYYFKLESMQIQ